MENSSTGLLAGLPERANVNFYVKPARGFFAWPAWLGWVGSGGKIEWVLAGWLEKSVLSAETSCIVDVHAVSWPALLPWWLRCLSLCAPPCKDGTAGRGFRQEEAVPLQGWAV